MWKFSSSRLKQMTIEVVVDLLLAMGVLGTVFAPAALGRAFGIL